MLSLIEKNSLWIKTSTIYSLFYKRMEETKTENGIILNSLPLGSFSDNLMRAYLGL